MSTLHPISGEKIYIGGALSDQAADFVAGDFTSQSWTLIDGWQSAGKLGDVAALIKTDLINRGRTVKQKGTNDADSNGAKGGSLPDPKPEKAAKLTPQEEAELARAHSEGE